MLARQLSRRIKEINAVNSENKLFKLSGRESCEGSLLGAVRSQKDSCGNEVANSPAQNWKQRQAGQHPPPSPGFSPIGRSAREAVPHGVSEFAMERNVLSYNYFGTEEVEREYFPPSFTPFVFWGVRRLINRICKGHTGS